MTVLALLAQDPVRGIHLRSMIDDRGLCSPAHRGSFYGYFVHGRLTGVALLGHYIICYGDDAAFAAFADAAVKSKANSRVLFGPQADVESIWGHLSQQGRETKHVQTHQWMVCEKARLPLGALQLRRANLDEAPLVAVAQAETIQQECGYDPRNNDPEGFLRRVADRIGRGRTWVRVDDGRVVFKAELMSVTPEAVYLEGIWTHPACRNRGIARECVSELVHRLLRRHKAICLVVEEQNITAQRVYQKVGFVLANSYQARYLHPLT